jgi:hypothetical protein
VIGCVLGTAAAVEVGPEATTCAEAAVLDFEASFLNSHPRMSGGDAQRSTTRIIAQIVFILYINVSSFVTSITSQSASISRQSACYDNAPLRQQLFIWPRARNPPVSLIGFRIVILSALFTSQQSSVKPLLAALFTFAVHHYLQYIHLTYTVWPKHFRSAPRGPPARFAGKQSGRKNQVRVVPPAVGSASHAIKHGRPWFAVITPKSVSECQFLPASN